MSNSATEDRARIDKWLWCTRFFKTRSEAAQAVRGGHVRVNGQRVKASREVVVGDQITVAKSILNYEVEVEQLPIRRGPAIEAAACYRESEESIAARASRLAAHRAAGATRQPPTSGRPDKHTRRLIRDRLRNQ